MCVRAVEGSGVHPVAHGRVRDDSGTGGTFHSDRDSESGGASEERWQRRRGEEGRGQEGVELSCRIWLAISLVVIVSLPYRVRRT